MVIIDTRKYGLKTLDDVYTHYCGKVIGKILWIFNIAYLLAMCATMIAGAGANVAQYFGVSDQIGRVVLAIAVLITCLFGFKEQQKGAEIKEKPINGTDEKESGESDICAGKGVTVPTALR